MITYNNRKIVYSFEYGGYAKKKELIITCCGLGLIILTLLAICIGLGISFEEPYKSRAVGIIVAFIVIAGVIPLLIVLFLLLKEKRNNNKIEQWLKADVVIKMTVEPWEFVTKPGSLFFPLYRFGVKFEINCVEHCKTSKHFDRFYKVIEGKKVDILYIPEYDQVLILK